MLRFFLIFLFTNSALATLKPCVWMQNSSKGLIFDLFRRRQHGMCHYKFNTLDSSLQKPKDIMVFMEGAPFWGEQGIIINCNNDQLSKQRICTIVQAGFYFNSLQKYQVVEQGNNISGLRGFTFMVKRTGNEKNKQKSGHKENIEIDLKLVNIGFGQLQAEIGSFEVDVVVKLICMMLSLILLCKIAKQPICSAYQFLQLFIFSKAIHICLFSVFYSLSVVSLSNQHKFTIYLILSMIFSFIIIGTILKCLLEYIQFGYPNFAQHSKITFMQQVKAKRQEYSGDSVYKKIMIGMGANLQQFLTFCQSQNGILKRFIMLSIILISSYLFQTQVFIVDLIISNLFVILLPSLLYFRNLNASDEIKINNNSCCQSHEYRSEAILSKIRINSFFALCFIQLLINENKFYTLEQNILVVCLIIAIWLIQNFFLRRYLSFRMSKKINIYKCNLIKQECWISKFTAKFDFLKKFHGLHQHQIQKASAGDCSICLESIEGEKCVKTQCQHLFHAACLQIWTKTKMICPIDRNSLNEDSLASVLSKLKETR